MKKRIMLFVRKALIDQRGQMIPWVALGMVAFLGVAGLSIDVGHAYVVRGQLQNTANASALAAAGLVYTSQSQSVNTTTQADQYSAGSGDENANPALGTVTTTVTSKCLNMLMPTGETCGSGSPPNAVQVTNSAAVKTHFMALFGMTTLNVSATATASMQGIANSWNVAIIVDGTQSMSTTDSNCGGLTEFQCALSGVQTFLAATNPCPPGGCSSGSKLRVSLFSFPNLDTTSGFSDTSTCSGPFTNEVYSLPTTTATTYSPIKYTGTSAFTATYQITDWDYNYYAPQSSSTSGLNSSDNLVKAIGYGYNSSTGAITHQGCLPNVGGESTYYGGVLYAAQAALVAEQAANPGSLNAIILLSDGQANADSSKFPQKTSTPSPAASGIAVTSSGSSTTNLTGGANTFGLYPDFNDECQQAIMAAQSAAAAGTRVYAVAYGSEDSGCGVGGTDTSLVATGQNASFTLSTLTPCVTMENIASSLNYFYSDYNQSGSGSSCQDASHTVSTLADIFLAISADFTTPRLIPNSAT
ncbi:MAG: pilus assembly protein TadG-related protein [Terracidiphilus sp.]